MKSFEQEVAETAQWMASPRFEGIVRPYAARQVVEQRGTFDSDYTLARTAAEGFYARLQELFALGQAITTFGTPFSINRRISNGSRTVNSTTNKSLAWTASTNV